jgi:hypothetical protein
MSLSVDIMFSIISLILLHVALNTAMSGTPQACTMILVLALSCTMTRILSRTKHRDKRRCLQLSLGRSRYRFNPAGYMNGRGERKNGKTIHFV